MNRLLCVLIVLGCACQTLAVPTFFTICVLPEFAGDDVICEHIIEQCGFFISSKKDSDSMYSSSDKSDHAIALEFMDQYVESVALDYNAANADNGKYNILIVRQNPDRRLQTLDDGSGDPCRYDLISLAKPSCDFEF